ncbi:MAG: OsmC family peroxiredoxin [Bacteroidetes bacterium RIFCSPLOWO2_12_FULL_35_15]|nr:MAG: OsmC family peroxiredoxin [Bacteroidetes bacterium RIFCSPLOWO2_12_FULL_35_15]
MERTAKAHWQGNIKDGKGTVSTQTGILKEAGYSHKSRFVEGVEGTNPEELLGAAHAGCFTMSVADILSKRGLIPKSLDTKATVTLIDLNITNIHLSITGDVSGITADEFTTVTKEAEKNCPVSKALKTSITSEAHLLVKEKMI